MKKQVIMDKTEHDILTAAYRFLESHGDRLPDINTPFSNAWWERTANDYLKMAEPFGEHPLALEVFPAIYHYIELKQRQGGKNQ